MLSIISAARGWEKNMSTATAVGIDSIAQIAINAHDLERATEFYRSRLGLKFLFQAGPKMSFFDCGGVRLMISLPETKELDHPSSIIYFKATDIKAAHAQLAER